MKVFLIAENEIPWGTLRVRRMYRSRKGGLIWE
jgi:hypothetical protein